MKAIKEGKDPNESNPKIEPAPEEDLPALDPNDPEVLMLEGGSKPQQASVEDVPDEQDKVESKAARQSSIDQSLHPSAQPSAQVSAQGSPGQPAFEPYPRDGYPYTAARDDNVSPMDSPHDRDGSVGGGYFPEVPTFTSENQDPTLQTAPPLDVMDLGLPDHPSGPPGLNLGLPEQPTAPPGRSADFESFPPPTLPDEPANAPQDFYRAPSPQPPPPTYPPPPQQPTYHAPPPVHHQPPPQRFNAPPPPPAKKNQLITDDVSIAKAQKHCRWAISALNFEDADTAVKELREALKTLGAS